MTAAPVVEAEFVETKFVETEPETVTPQAPHPRTAPTAPEVALRSAPKPDVDPNQLTPAELYNAYCTPCHSLQLIESQRLTRSMWDWVMDDMINEDGATWITDDERKILVDYLVENFGPKPR